MTANNAKPTPGPWTIHEELPHQFGDMETGWTDYGGFRIDAPGVEQLSYVWNLGRRVPLAGTQENGPLFGANEARANAALIAEAGTVYHETGLTPRQLAEQRAELLATLDSIMNHAADFALDDAEACNSIHVIARAAIARCKETTA